MSYELGSLLSVGTGAALEQVVVLSDGRVATKLFAGKPVERRDILNLSDWLLLADGQNITVVLPLNKGATVATPAPVAMATPEPEPVPTVYPVGTMLRWIKDDQNKRSALVMKDCVLQVKEIIAGRTTMNDYTLVKRTPFKDFAEWKASLPEGGAITAGAVAPWAPTIEEKAKAPIVATTDAGYIAEISNRYLVRTQLYERSSINQNIENARKSLKREIDNFMVNTSVDNINIDKIVSFSNYINYYAKWVQRQLLEARGKTPEELSRVIFTFHNNYKQKLFAYKNGLKYEIAATKSGNLALAPSAEGTRYRGPALMAQNFAGLGIEMKADGKPRLEVSYYRRRIEL
jgi:hypothetical protein